MSQTFASVGSRPHRVALQNPGPAVPNGDGSYTQTWVDCAPPAMFAAIEVATARNTSMESTANATIISAATHLIEIPFHPQVSTLTRVLLNGRVFAVTSVDNVNQDDISLRLVAVETIQ